MKRMYLEDISRIIQNKELLEARLDVKIANRGKEIFINGNAVDEYLAEKVLQALSFGFPMKFALLIRDEEDYEFEILNIKDFTKRKDLKRVRARIIGSNGKTLKNLCQLTKCFFELKDNNIGIIGNANYIKNAMDSIIYLIHGTKQANVYAFLEKHQPEEIVDFGLKKAKRKYKKRKTSNKNL